MSSLFFNSYKSQDNDRYPFNGFLFTNAGATGAYGPSISQIRASYPTSWAQYDSNVNSVEDGIQYWRAPQTSNYQLIAAGARGGRTTDGRGVIISSNISLQRNQILKILVGQVGSWNNGLGSGGGGGTFIATPDNKPILVAGGGGGNWNTTVGDNAVITTSGTNGGSGGIGGSDGFGGRTNDNRTDDPGAGFYTNSGNTTSLNIIGGYAFIFGGRGAPGTLEFGGFGGGGYPGGGGGGGYSGGGGTQGGAGGTCGGGGSFDISNVGTNFARQYLPAINNQTGGLNTNHGFVFIKQIKTVPALDDLSTSTRSALKGVYAYRRVFSSYTGPIMRIRNPVNNAETNVFWDFTTSQLWTGQGATGTPITFWLNFQTGNVVTWYDQSGAGNHATQSTAGIQPRLDTSNERVDFTVSGSYFFLPQGTVPLNRTYTMSFKHGTATATGGLIGGGIFSASQTNCVRFDGTNNYFNYWNANDHNPQNNTPNLDNAVVSFVNYVTGNAPTFTTSTSATGTVSTSWTSAAYINNRPFPTNPTATRTNWNGTLGTDTLGKTSTNEPMGVPMYWAFVSNDAMNGDERTLVEFQ